MANTLCVLLCFCFVLQTVFCQFGFFQPRENRNSLLFGQGGLFQAPNRIREGIHGLFQPHRQRPGFNQGTTQGEIYVTEPYTFENGPNTVVPTATVYYDQNIGNVNFPGPVQGNNGFQPNGGNNGANFNDNEQNYPNNGNVQENTPQNGREGENVDPPNDQVIFESTPSDTLVHLTPAPKIVAENRNNFNFATTQDFSETCKTVEGGLGRCISLYDCPKYLKFIQESRAQAMRVLRQAHCGFEGNNPKVCCPLPGFTTAAPEPPTTASTTTTTTTTTPAPQPPSPLPKSAGDFVDALPEPPICGMSNATFSRVVGGVDAKLGDLPWMVLLGYKNRLGDTSWLCGGSLITSRHTLTAAHCIHNHEKDLYVARLGELDTAREDEGATPVDLLIKEKIKHEQYSATSFTNDIGILVLERDVQYTDLIRPICMPRNSELRSKTFEDFNPLIAGWGHTEFRGPSATHLQVLQLPVVSNDFCAQAYKPYKAQTIDQRVLCAGFKKGGKDACQGDSGGPLMQPIWSSETLKTFFYQIGVVSYGKKCAEAGFPGVYSRVTHFIPWIEEKVLGRSSR